MKRIISIFLAAVFCFAFFGCDKEAKTGNNSVMNSAQETSKKIEAESKESFSATSSSDNTNATYDENGQSGGELLPRKYRNNYYSIPTFFIRIVGKDTFEKWETEYLANNYADDTNVMVMAAYIKEFNISKEDFERANLEYAKFIDETYSHICLDPQDYADQEMQEIYNTEIIYTLDNEIINEYYLGIDYPFLNEYQYDEAIEAGTYETRTTEFIDIKQMEAEIIAKYGEAEIVTETAEAIPEETTVTA